MNIYLLNKNLNKKININILTFYLIFLYLIKNTLFFLFGSRLASQMMNNQKNEIKEIIIAFRAEPLVINEKTIQNCKMK